MKEKKIIAILPIGKVFDRAFEGIEKAARENGATVKRLEPEFSAAGKLGSLCKSIEGAELIVADISARNPNVMYLAGYAHGIGRPVQMISQCGEDAPFDQTKHPLLVYGSDVEFLRTELSAILRGEGRTAKAKSSGTIDPREKFLATFGDLMKKHQQEHEGEIQMENPTTFVLVNQELELPLVQDLARRARELGMRIKLM